MKAVTIDNFDLEIHSQYARDKGLYDPKMIHDAQSVSPSCEIAGTSSIYSSKWEELFELGNCNIPWALFAAPVSFRMQRNKYFRFSILPSIEDYLDGEEEEEENDDDQEVRSELIQKILNAQKSKHQPNDLFEKERSALLNFIGSVKFLNKLLTQINARKLQYQKG